MTERKKKISLIIPMYNVENYIDECLNSVINQDYGIQNIEGITSSNPSYISDSFWPMILGQTGFLGLIAYICALLILFLEIQRLAQKNCYRYTSALCILVYLLISSTSESAFANPMAVPLAIYLGKMLQAESVSK